MTLSTLVRGCVGESRESYLFREKRMIRDHGMTTHDVGNVTRFVGVGSLVSK